MLTDEQLKEYGESDECKRLKEVNAKWKSEFDKCEKFKGEIVEDLLVTPEFLETLATALRAENDHRAAYNRICGTNLSPLRLRVRLPEFALYP